MGVLVRVEQGTWLLDKVTISSSRSAHIDRCERVWGTSVESVGKRRCPLLLTPRLSLLLCPTPTLPLSRRFVCREKIGVRTGEGATWLVPVPVGAYVYGSGESTVILTKVREKGFREEGHV